MRLKATIIQQPAIRLITCKSRSFPDGNREAFNTIESRLDSLRGRKFYALVYGAADGLQYFAGLVPQSVEEERWFTHHGFGIIEVEAGTWAQSKLDDWLSNTDQIGSMFDSMIAAYGHDPSRPQMEFYRSMTELHLLVPVSPGGAKSNRQEIRI